MENGRNEFRSHDRICVWTALVLVSVVEDSDAQRQHHCLFPTGMDVFAGRDWCTQRIFRYGRGMATIRNYTSWIPSVTMGREASFRDGILCLWHRKFRTS